MNFETPIPNVAVIFPAKNQERTIQHVINTAKKSNHNPQVIVVDAFSSDRTFELANNAGVTVIQQEVKLFPGKGIAMKTGLKEAIKLNSNIILFLDADITNLTPDWVDNLVDGCTNCDMVRGCYLRHPRDAAVTKLIAKPLLNVFLPELSHMEHIHLPVYMGGVFYCDIG
ncbi:MAG TPA: glycosyltransferase [Nitrososphaeraceae archaeon]